MSLFQVEGLIKRFGGLLATDHVSLSVERGEIHALIGPNGAGKTTLVNQISGLLQPDAGRVLLDGVDITPLPMHRRVAHGLSRCFQVTRIFPAQTVRDNLLLAVQAHSGSSFRFLQPRSQAAELYAKADQLAERVGLQHSLAETAGALPHGAQRTLDVALALAASPKLLLLDEPMGALDKKLRSKMQLELVEIIERVGVTCVMVTHDQEEAMTMAERIAIMHLGCIEQIGSPMDIYETPASRLVCEFIGNVNLFDGLLVEDEQDHATIACADLEQPIYVGHGISSRAENKKVTYALRPEKLLMSLHKPEEIEHPDFNWTKGEVYDIAYLGGHSVYHIQLPSGKIVQAFIANAERHGKRPTWDDQVFLYWEDDSGVVLQS